MTTCTMPGFFVALRAPVFGKSVHMFFFFSWAIQVMLTAPLVNLPSAWPLVKPWTNVNFIILGLLLKAIIVLNTSAYTF